MRTAADILAEHRIGRVRNCAAYTTTCPHCSHTRRKKRDRCLSVLIDERGVRWKCHHATCSWQGWEFFNGPAGRPAAVAATNPTTSINDDDGDRCRVARARTIFAQAVDPTGTLVEVYLASRRLRLLDGMANRVVRFHPRCPWRDDETEQLVYVPAMITALVDIHTNELNAVQRTALRPDGSKIARKMTGVAKGSCVKIDADEAVTTSLALAEGFETALAIALSGWRPIWAAGSAGAIEQFPVLDGVECLTIFADADQNGTGLAAARTCAARWRHADHEVKIKPPT
jgi:hypothetical protein